MKSLTCTRKYKEHIICYSISLATTFFLFIFIYGTRLRSVNDNVEEPDYNVMSNWAARPETADGADYVAAGCGENRQNKGVLADTFYVHPTSFFDETLIHSHTQDMLTNYVIDSGNLPLTSSAFNSATNVYAPRYRSVSQKFQDNGQHENKTTESLKAAMILAANDVKDAFEYYLTHFNKGRPFLLASHSQGTLHAKELLNYLLENHKDVMKELFIAAYLIGNTIEDGDIPSINSVHVCQNSTDTNCYLSYNAVPSTPESMKKSLNITFGKHRHWWIRKSKSGKIVCVNPLTWKHDDEMGGFNLHLGSTPLTPLFLTKLDAQFVQAKCSHNGVLHVTLKDPNKSGYGEFEGDSPLHPYDYPYFYKNIRINVNERVNAFLKQKGSANFVPLAEEKCFECGESSDCWNQIFGDICMIIILPIIIISPLIISSILCVRKCVLKKSSLSQPRICFYSWCCAFFILYRCFKKYRRTEIKKETEESTNNRKSITGIELKSSGI